MIEDKTSEEFAKLPLEERAKIVLRKYDAASKININATSLADFDPVLEAWDYLTENKYMELVGGTPKSGASYKITPEGFDFMND